MFWDLHEWNSLQGIVPTLLRINCASYNVVCPHFGMGDYGTKKLLEVGSETSARDENSNESPSTLTLAGSRLGCL